MTATPIVRRIQLGLLLKDMRMKADLTPAQVAHKMGWDRSKVSRLEKGGVTQISGPDINQLLDIYGVTDEMDVQHAHELGVEARRRGEYGGVRQDTRDFVGMEANAAALRVHYSDLVPGLLQTRDYARALISSAVTLRTETERQQMLEGRMRRQSVLDTVKRYEVVLGEAALRYQVGGPQVMRAQMKHLLAASERPNMSLRVLTFEQAAITQCLGTPFHIVSLSQPAMTLVYIEGLTNSHYPDSATAVEAHTLAFERLVQAALTEEETRDLLRRGLSEN